VEYLVLASKRPTFFLRRGDRLIARLKALLYTWRFSEQVNGRVVMCWPDRNEIWDKFDGEDFSPTRIFDLQQFYAQGGGDSLIFLEGTCPFPAERRSLRDAEFGEMQPFNFDRDYFIREAPVLHEQSSVTFQFKGEPRSAEYLNKQVRDLYARLPHDPVVVRGVDLGRQVLGSGYVGLHYRRGDVDERLRIELPGIVDGSLAPQRLALMLGHYVCRTALDHFYYPAIDDAIREGRKLVYFTDTPGSLEHFTEKFGKRHFVDAERFKGRIPIQKAFIDFNLLAKASQIIGTGSNYATFAAVLGNAEMINVCTNGGFEDLERNLYDKYLSGVRLSPSQQKTLTDELDRQLKRRSKLRPLEMVEEAPMMRAAAASSEAGRRPATLSQDPPEAEAAPEVEAVPAVAAGRKRALSGLLRFRK
jgi:hypothetical protein